MPNPSQMPPKERAARSRLLQIIRDSGLIRATWVQLCRPCGKAGCGCAKSKRRWHKSWSISQSRDGKLRRKSIPSSLHEDVGRWLTEYWEARHLLDEISEQYWSRLERPKKRQRKR